MKDKKYKGLNKKDDNFDVNEVFADFGEKTTIKEKEKTFNFDFDFAPSKQDAKFDFDFGQEVKKKDNLDDLFKFN